MLNLKLVSFCTLRFIHKFVVRKLRNEMRLRNLMIYFIAITCLTNCKSNELKIKMEQEEKQIIKICNEFAKQADELETKGFNNFDYKENGFTEDFNKLFDQYCYGKQNRTVSGLNFRQPARYSNLAFSKKEIIEKKSKTRYQVTFEKEPKVGSIRFILDKKNGNWKLTRFETYIGISRHSKNVEEEIWRKHKL